MPDLGKACLIAILFAIDGPANLVRQELGQETKVDRETLIEQTRRKAKLTQSNYDRILKLSKKGSASQSELRRAKYENQITKLNLSNLLSPVKRERNALLAAKINLDYAVKELEVVKNLYRRGSASKINYQRAVTARNVALSQLRSLENVAKVKFHDFEAAKSKFEQAHSEYKLALPLFERGSISKTTFEIVESRYKAAETEFAAQKKKLGARAVVVEK